MSSLTRGVPPRSRRGGLLAAFAVAAVASACESPPAPVPYVAPAPGTVYDYGDFTNTVTRVDGWRTTFTDDRGRPGQRLALFITEDPQRPLVVDAAALDSLWPLQLGRRLTLRTQQGDELFKWEFRVLDTATIEVPAGRFATTVVEGVQTPELVHSPRTAGSVVHTWWYAPEANAVVRFESAYLLGPAAGRRFEGTLKAIRAPGARADSGPAATPPAGPAASPGPPAPGGSAPPR